MAASRIELVTDASAWRAEDYPRREQWTRRLTPDMLADLDRAIRGAIDRGVDYGTITAEDFPIPACTGLLDEVRAELDTGRGFAVVGGFPVDKYSYEENRIAFCGIAANMGVMVDQSSKRDRVIDVRDEHKGYDPSNRAYHSNRLIPFHMDGADVAGLLCLETALEGGESLIVSAATIYNEIAKTRPDLLDIYFRGFHQHRRGEQGEGEPVVTAYRLPVFGFRNGLFHSFYDRTPAEWAAKELGTPLTDREVEALDLFDEIAHRPDLRLHMKFERGDMQFVSNLTVMHSRTGYVDKPDRVRHLIRVWVNFPDGKRSGMNKINLYAPWDARVHAVS